MDWLICVDRPRRQARDRSRHQATIQRRREKDSAHQCEENEPLLSNGPAPPRPEDSKKGRRWGRKQQQQQQQQQGGSDSVTSGHASAPFRPEGSKKKWRWPWGKKHKEQGESGASHSDQTITEGHTSDKRSTIESAKQNSVPVAHSEGDSTDGGVTPSSYLVHTHARVEQQTVEHANAVRLIVDFNSAMRGYHFETEVLFCGCRLQKYWFRGRSQATSEEVVATEAPLSKKCALNMKADIRELNNLLHELSKHPLLQPIYMTEYYEDKVLMVQPLVRRGSLRDLLHGVKQPLSDWSLKYREGGGMSLDRDAIPLLGKMILEAVDFLYGCGLPPLGHVQSGNIYITERGCRLGGYENTLLGYKSRFHSFCWQYGNKIDIIMFGHVIYEMACEGRELTSAVPEDNDYHSVTDCRVRQFLRHIFSQVDEDVDYRASLQKILQSDFFVRLDAPKDHWIEHEVSAKGKRLLSKVCEESEKKQKEGQKVEKSNRKEKCLKIMKHYADKKENLEVRAEVDVLEIGSRAGKHWALMEDGDSALFDLISVAKVSKQCPILLTSSCIATISNFFTILQNHPLLQPVTDLKFYNGHVLLCQPFVEDGSIRDLIYRTNPWSVWTSKVGSRGSKLEKNMIQIYSKQILEACWFLYDVGFSQLRNIHSGNVLVDREEQVCRLGGYENALLGYSAPNSPLLPQHHGAHIDRLMFGHLVYEMAAGMRLQNVTPSDGEYRSCDSTVRAFLKAVFSIENGVTDPKAWVSELRKNKFIKKAKLREDVQRQLDSIHSEVSGASIPTAMKDVFRKVGRNKPHKQLPSQIQILL